MRCAHFRTRIAAVAVALFVVGLAACGDDDDDSADTAAATATTAAPAATSATTGGAAAPAGAGVTEVIKGTAFTTKEVKVGVGGVVTFDNQDATTHTATADDGSFDTGNISGGTTKPITFDKAGTFAFHCAIHSFMTAIVVVA